MTSSVLLQRFLTGLRPERSRQLLLHKKLSNFTKALADAVDIKYALKFNEPDVNIQAMAQPQRKPEQPDTVAVTVIKELICAAVFHSLCQMLGITNTRTSAYHPQRKWPGGAI